MRPGINLYADGRTELMDICDESTYYFVELKATEVKV